MTRDERGQKVAEAIAALPELYRAAVTLETAAQHRPTDYLAAWEAVEKAGATVHRQARLLAGKSKGG